MPENNEKRKKDNNAFRVLVTVDLSRGDWSELQPVELLSGAEVVLLGVYPITDQVAPEQARDQFQEQASADLESLADRFHQANLNVDTELVFAVDLKEALNRVAEKMNCHAVLTWNDELVFSKLAVLHRGEAEMNQMMDYVARIMAEQSQDVDLIHLYEGGLEEREVTRRRNLLGQQRGLLVEKGLKQGQINIILENVSDVDGALVEKASKYDAIVMGETEPSVKSRLFGTRHELVVEHAKGVVLIVRASHRDV